MGDYPERRHHRPERCRRAEAKLQGGHQTKRVKLYGRATDGGTTAAAEADGLAAEWAVVGAAGAEPGMTWSAVVAVVADESGSPLEVVIVDGGEDPVATVAAVVDSSERYLAVAMEDSSWEDPVAAVVASREDPAMAAVDIREDQSGGGGRDGLRCRQARGGGSGVDRLLTALVFSGEGSVSGGQSLKLRNTRRRLHRSCSAASARLRAAACCRACSSLSRRRFSSWSRRCRRCCSR